MSNKTKESLFYNTLIPLIFQVLRFFVAIIIARILDPKDFGIIGLASIVIFYSNSLTNFGFSTALINKSEINDHHINSLFTIDLLISSILCITTFFSSGYIASFFDIDELDLVLKALASIFFITSFSMVPVALLKRDLRFKTLSLIEISSSLSQSVLVLILAFMEFHYWAMVTGMILANIVSSFLALVATKWRPRLLINLKAIKEVINYASWNFLESQLRLVENYIDKFLVGKLLGPVNLGYYEKAIGFAIMPVESIVHRITGVMFSTFSRNKTNDIDMLYYLERSIVLVSIVCFPVFAGFAIVSDYFVLVLLGEKWAPMIPPLYFLLGAYSVYSVVASINVFNLASGSYKSQIKSRILCIALLTVALFLFAGQGITFVAIIMFSYHTVFLFCSLSLVGRRMHISLSRFVMWLLPAFLLTLLMIVSVKVSSNLFFSQKTMFNLLSLVGIGGFCYVSCFFLFNFSSTNFLRRESVSMVKKMYSKLL
jgi:O-antigen/teichoic acid export membrane protein